MPNDSRFMEPLQLAGRIIMENGGETYRVEETITRMGRAFGLSGVESFAVPSGVFVSFQKSDGGTETGVIRVRSGGTNLLRVNEVNAVSRQVEAGQLTCEETVCRLREIACMPGVVARRWLPVAAAISAGGFAVMFGGGWTDLLLAMVITGLVMLFSGMMERMHITAMVNTLLCALLSTLVPLCVHAASGLGLTESIIAGALMPLLPGLAMTNAVQDTMRGDILSGITHCVQAVLTAGVVAGGALMATWLFYLLTGGAA